MSNYDKPIGYYLYTNTISKDNLEKNITYESFKQNANLIINNFGNNYYSELEEKLFIKKATVEKVSIDFFKNIFNYSFLVKYKKLIIDSYGENEFNDWINLYK